MSLFSDNIRSLRDKKELSQEKLAEKLLITRGRYVKYEDGSSEPPYDILMRIARFFQVSIDILLSVDVRKIPVDDLLLLEGNRVLLPITVDVHGNNLIEVVTEKARAGYATGYADPEYIGNLQQIQLPFLGHGKHRGFPVSGDSMPPHENGDIIIGRYVEKLGEIMDGKTYIVVTREDGIVYKRLNKNGKNALVLESDNTLYAPYSVKASEILEIWEYQCSVAKSDKKIAAAPDTVEGMFLELKREMDLIKGISKA